MTSSCLVNWTATTKQAGDSSLMAVYCDAACPMRWISGEARFDNDCGSQEEDLVCGEVPLPPKTRVCMGSYFAPESHGEPLVIKWRNETKGKEEAGQSWACQQGTTQFSPAIKTHGIDSSS